jgi:imidazolonepropionase-like amidohydrolase
MGDIQSLVLRGGTLIDVRTGTRTSEAAVVIEGGQITEVGTADAVAIPAGAEVVDTAGAWLIPGLVDMHVHLTFDPLATKLLPLYLAHGVTTVRDMGGALTVLSLLRDDLAAGKQLGPRLFFAGPILDGMPPLWPTHSLLVTTVQRARSVVRMLLDQGVDCVKVYNYVPEEALAAIVEEACAGGRMVLGHVPRSISTSRAIELGMGCLEHIRVTGRELLPLDEADRLDYLPLGTRETLLWERFEVESAGMDRLIERMVEARVFLDPTMIVDAATFGVPIHDEAALAVEGQLPEEARRLLNREGWIDNLSGPPELRERAQTGFEKRLRFLDRCNRAGVRMLAGTDTFGPGAMLPGAGLLNELELLNRAGLSPLQALQAATVTAAEALGASEQMGALEPGKVADVVVLDADPLADIRHARSARLVVKAGEQFTPAKLIELAAQGVA